MKNKKLLACKEKREWMGMSQSQKLYYVERLFYIVNYLTNHEFASSKKLAELCHISQRTIFRDMKKLEEVGFYFNVDSKYGYKMIYTPTKVGNHLTQDEFIALMLYPFLSVGKVSEKHPLDLAYRKGIEKIARFVKKTDLFNIESKLYIEERIYVHSRLRTPQEFKVLPMIINAMAGNFTVEVDYYTISRNKQNTRKIDPYNFIQRGGHLYVVAYCHVRKEVRVFRLERFSDIRLTNDTFIIPSTFDMDQFLADRWSIMDEGTSTTFIVHFNATIARYVVEQDFHVDASIDQYEDGSLTLTTTVKSREEFLRWVWSFGTKATVMSPEDIREQLRSEYEELVERYR